MLDRVRTKLTYANVMVTVLTFVVFGGAAYATVLAPKNSINSRAIIDGQVKARDIKDGAVTSLKLTPGLGRVYSKRIDPAFNTSGQTILTVPGFGAFRVTVCFTQKAAMSFRNQAGQALEVSDTEASGGSYDAIIQDGSDAASVTDSGLQVWQIAHDVGRRTALATITTLSVPGFDGSNSCVFEAQAVVQQP